MDIQKQNTAGIPDKTWEAMAKDVKMWMVSFIQTFSECMEIISPAQVTGEAKKKNQMAFSNIETLLGGEISGIPANINILFTGENNILAAEQGAAAAVKSAMLMVSDEQQDVIVEKIGEKLEKLGLDTINVFRIALTDVSTFIGTFVSTTYLRLRRNGIPEKDKRIFSFKTAGCSLAIAGMIFTSAQELSGKGLFQGKISTMEELESVLNDLSLTSDPMLETALINILGEDWIKKAPQDEKNFRSLAELTGKELPDAIKREVIRELRTKTYSIFDYVEKNFSGKGLKLNSDERDAFVRPLTMMLAIQGNKDDALAVQLMANPESSPIYDWMAKRNINPLELVSRYLEYPEETRDRNIVIQAAGHMYGDPDSQKVLKDIKDRIEKQHLDTERFASGNGRERI